MDCEVSAWTDWDNCDRALAALEGASLAVSHLDILYGTDDYCGASLFTDVHLHVHVQVQGADAYTCACAFACTGAPCIMVQILYRSLHKMPIILGTVI